MRINQWKRSAKDIRMGRAFTRMDDAILFFYAEGGYIQSRSDLSISKLIAVFSHQHWLQVVVYKPAGESNYRKGLLVNPYQVSRLKHHGII